MTTINHTERAKSMHSTDVPSILGLEGARRSDHTIWLEKGGRLEEWDGNNATEAGKYLESSILDYAESELGPLKRNVRCEAKGIDFPLVSTLDSQVIASGVPAEAKTTGIVGPVFGEWGEQGTDVLPPLYLVQVSMQMLCSGAELAYLYALIGGRGFVSYTIHRDDELINAIVDRCSKWWDRHVTKGIEPDRTEPVPMEIIKRLRRVPEKTIELNGTSDLLVAEFEATRAAKSSAEKAHEAAKSNLIMALGDAEAGRLVDGRLVTFLESARRGYTVDDTTFRTLRIKKA